MEYIMFEFWEFVSFINLLIVYADLDHYYVPLETPNSQVYSPQNIDNYNT